MKRLSISYRGNGHFGRVYGKCQLRRKVGHKKPCIRAIFQQSGVERVNSRLLKEMLLGC
jgi:hypothetical protein